VTCGAVWLNSGIDKNDGGIDRNVDDSKVQGYLRLLTLTMTLQHGGNAPSSSGKRRCNFQISTEMLITGRMCWSVPYNYDASARPPPPVEVL